MSHRVTDRKSLRCAALRVYGHRHDDRVAPVLPEEESELPAEHAQGPREPQPPGCSLEAVLAGAHKADGAVDGAVGAEGGDQLPQRGAQLHQPLPTLLLGRGRWWRWRQLGARSGPRPPTSCLGHGSSLNPRSEPQWGPSPPSGLTPPRCPHPGPCHRLPFSVPGNSRDRRVPQPPVAQPGLLMPKRGPIRSWSILGTDAAALPCDDRQGTRRPPRVCLVMARAEPGRWGRDSRGHGVQATPGLVCRQARGWVGLCCHLPSGPGASGEGQPGDLLRVGLEPSAED